MDKKERSIHSISKLENQFDLCEITIDSIWIYPVLKQCFFFPAIFNVNSDRIEIKNSTNKNTLFIKNLIKSVQWSLKNKKLQQYDIFLSEYASSRIKSDNIYYSIWSDFLWEILPDSIINFEKPLKDKKFNHFVKIKTPNVFYADFFITKALLKSKLKKLNTLIDHEKIKPLFEFLNISYNPLKVEIQVNKFFIFLDQYKKLLKRINPKIVIINTAYEYTNMALCLACHFQNIPTIEFQHGVIYDAHPGYTYKQVCGHSLFPKYIFAYGIYHANLISQNSEIANSQNIIPVGFPYIEKVYYEPCNLKDDIQKQCSGYKNLYFTSQWTIREKLRAFVIELAKILPSGYKIIYKTHPREKWTSKFYKQLMNQKNIQFISSVEISSLEIMKLSFVHSTVYSTSYFESLFFGLPNILIRHPTFSSTVQNFVDNKYTYMVNTPQEYLETLNKIESIKDCNSKVREFSYRYFLKDSLENMKIHISHIMNEKSKNDNNC